MRRNINSQRYSLYSTNKNSRAKSTFPTKRNNFFNIFEKFSKVSAKPKPQRSNSLNGLELDQTFYFQVAAISILTFAVILFFQSFLGGETISTSAIQRQEEEVRLLTNFQYLPKDSATKTNLKPIEVVVVPEKSPEIKQLELDQKIELEKTKSRYTVKTGDNVYTIALQYKVETAEIIAANNLEDPSKIKVGQVLIIP
jgi:LysM repeat protein